MNETLPPYDKFETYIEKLKLDEKEVELLNTYSPIFLKHKEEFANFLHQEFLDITETGLILEREERPGFLVKVWALWFESLVTRGLDRSFHAYLWKVGLRHVEVGLDQRFSNLGFSLVRQFCQKIISSEIPADDRLRITATLDALIDLCLLIETTAFIEATTRCDMEVIRGIADKVRNPVAIMGGNIRRLQRKADPESNAYGTYSDLIAQTSRLERIVQDIKIYNEMFTREQEITFVHPEAPIRTALEKLAVQLAEKKIQVSLELGSLPFVRADRSDMDQLFYCLFQNSIDAIDLSDPVIRITASTAGDPYQDVRIAIFNTGLPPKEDDLEKLVSPFYSTKSQGTGFGLAIVQLAVKRSFGKLTIEPVEGKGTTVTVILPASSD
ncbi:MAG: hypothetical protein C0402_10235 [Thermodesulfovibrio sp.]|nr:hypothetical protein [Thermodesulfovibrio sp.]